MRSHVPAHVEYPKTQTLFETIGPSGDHLVETHIFSDHQTESHKNKQVLLMNSEFSRNFIFWIWFLD